MAPAFLVTSYALNVTPQQFTCAIENSQFVHVTSVIIAHYRFTHAVFFYLVLYYFFLRVTLV